MIGGQQTNIHKGNHCGRNLLRSDREDSLFLDLFIKRWCSSPALRISLTQVILKEMGGLDYQHDAGDAEFGKSSIDIVRFISN